MISYDSHCNEVRTSKRRPVQALIECDALTRLDTMLRSSKKEVRKEACWIVSNVTAGPLEHVQSVCTAGLVPRLIELSTSGRDDFEVRKEAAYALCNACSCNSVPLLSGLVQLGVVPAFCDLLDCADATLLLSVLEALEAVLGAAAAAAAAAAAIPGENACAQIFAESGGLSKLEALQTHENGEVYRRVVKLLDTFFGADEDDPTLVPPAHADGFAFGLPPQAAAATQPMTFFP